MFFTYIFIQKLLFRCTCLIHMGKFNIMSVRGSAEAESTKNTYALHLFAMHTLSCPGPTTVMLDKWHQY